MVKRATQAVLLLVLNLLYWPATVLAQSSSWEGYDARLEGYGGQNVTIEGSSTALTWILFLFLAIVCVGVTFKNAKRTHLD